MTQIYNFDGYFIGRNKFVSLDVCTNRIAFYLNTYERVQVGKRAGDRIHDIYKSPSCKSQHLHTYIHTYILYLYSIHIPHHAGLPPPRAPPPNLPGMYISRCSLIVKACYMHICICNYIPSECRAHLQVHIFICFPAYRRYRPLLFSRSYQRREQRR